MDAKLEYLYNRKDDYIKQLSQVRARLQRQRNLLFISAIVFLALHFLNLSPQEISILGIKLQAIDFAKLLFLVPIIITYQITYYHESKVEERRLNITLKSLLKYLESQVELSLEELTKDSSYISKRGTYYNVHNKGKIASASVQLMKTVLWLPVVILFAISAIKSVSDVLIHASMVTFWLYLAILIFCIIIILFSRLSVALAYRQGKYDYKPDKKPTTSVKQNSTDL